MIGMVDKSNGPSDIDRLEQEVAKLRDEVQRISSAIPPQNTQGNESPKRNFAQSLSDYVNDVVESVTSGISSEIEKSVFVDPTGAWFDRHIARVQARSITPAEAERACDTDECDGERAPLADSKRATLRREIRERDGGCSEGPFFEHHLKPPQNTSGEWTCGSGGRPWALLGHSSRKNCSENGYPPHPFLGTTKILAPQNGVRQVLVDLRRAGRRGM